MTESFQSWAAVKVVGLVASIVAGLAIGAVLAAVDDVESRYEQRGAIVADQPAGNPLQALVRAGDAEIVTAVPAQAQVGDRVDVWFSIEDQRLVRAADAGEAPYVSTGEAMLIGAAYAGLGSLLFAAFDLVRWASADRRRPAYRY